MDKVYRVDPRAVIDAEKVLKEWKGEWGGEPEGWKLINFPVMRDGTVLAVFGLREEADVKGKSHSMMRCRVIRYDVSGREPAVLGKYSFHWFDGDLGTVFMRGNELWAVITTLHSLDYHVVNIHPWTGFKTGCEFCIGRYIKTIGYPGNGSLAVAYENSLHTEDNLLISFFDPDGKNTDITGEGDVLECRDLVVDRRGDVWAYFFPGDLLHRFDAEGNHEGECRVSMQGFGCFGFNDDNSKLMLHFNVYSDQCLIYVMDRDENGNYMKGHRFDFAPVDEDGNRIDAPDCTDYGVPSVCGSHMVLRVNNRLYYYDLNDFDDAHLVVKDDRPDIASLL